MKRRTFLLGLSAGTTAAMASGGALAQTKTMRLHGALPAPAIIPAQIVTPFIERVREASNRELDIQKFDTMALGGKPPEIYQQAIDGIVDMGYTLPGYTPGRFPRSEVFELPFLMRDPVATSLAFNQMVEDDFKNNEFADVKILAAWVHGPGVLHSKDPIGRLEDLKGLKMRAPTRLTNLLLRELGATPVGMPVPAVPEALSKGVIDGAVVPWEITRPLRMSELVEYHTELAGPEALYTGTFILAMNKSSYEQLPDDLKAVIDAESGAKLTELAARAMLDGDAPARQIAVDKGNEIVQLDETEVVRWKDAGAKVEAAWIAEMAEKEIDGQAILDRAKALIEEMSA